MKKVARWIALGICLFGLAEAQDPLPWWTGLESQPYDAEKAPRMEMEFRERQFVDRANRFAKLWTQFAREYNDRRAVDVKTARAVSKAFRELERGGGWPRD